MRYQTAREHSESFRLTALLLRDALRTFKSKPVLTLSEWAEQYGRLSGESSAEVGRFRPYPYQIGIMDAMSDPEIEQVTVMKSARVGWTKMLNFAIGYYATQDPCSMLLVQPTEGDARDYSKQELAPMIRDIRELRGLFEDVNPGNQKDTILTKSYAGGLLHVIGATTPRSFRRIQTRLNLYDELDGWPDTTPEGDQEELAAKRNLTAWNRKTCAGSTPTDKGYSRIERRFLESDQRYFNIPCMRCGAFQVLSLRNNIRWDKGEPLGAWHECCMCGGRNDGHEKHAMVSAGKWIATQPFRGHAGFHIWSGYSFSPNTSWGELAAEFERCRKTPEKLKTYVNTVLGELWEPQDEDFNKEHRSELMARIESYGPPIPMAAGVLVSGVDVQHDRLECEIRAFAKDHESWSIEHKVIFGQPDQTTVWAELTDFLFNTPRYHQSGAPMPVSICLVDAGYLTEVVYSYCKQQRLKGRKVYSTMGSSVAQKALFERAGRNQRTKLNFTLATIQLKDLIFSRLNTAKTEFIDEETYLPLTEQPVRRYPYYQHFGSHCTEVYFQQLLSEKKVSKTSGGKFKRVYQQTVERNEILDLFVLHVAGLAILNPNWSRVFAQLAARKQATVVPPTAEIGPVDRPAKGRTERRFPGKSPWGYRPGWVKNW